MNTPAREIGIREFQQNLYKEIAKGFPITVTRHGMPFLSIYAPDTVIQVKTETLASIREAVFNRDNHLCLDCGATTDLTVDHKKPQIIGGEDTVENLETVCRSCNSKRYHELLKKALHHYHDCPDALGVSEPAPEKIAADQTGWVKKCEVPGLKCEALGKQYEIVYVDEDGEHRVKNYLCEAHLRLSKQGAESIMEVE